MTRPKEKEFPTPVLNSASLASVCLSTSLQASGMECSRMGCRLHELFPSDAENTGSSQCWCLVPGWDFPKADYLEAASISGWATIALTPHQAPGSLSLACFLPSLHSNSGQCRLCSKSFVYSY